MNDDLTLNEVNKIVSNPVQNKDAILLVKQPDGNWRGFMNRNDSIIQARQADPTIVLQMLLTHP